VTRSCAQRGFTLVELLVVVAVLAVLVSVLLPALSGARSGAQMIQGASNVRQLNIAAAAYTADHDMFNMPAARDRLANLHRWFGTRNAQGEAFRPAGGPISPYLDDVGSAGNTSLAVAPSSASNDTRAPSIESLGVRACPRFAPILEQRQEDGLGFELGCGGYGYNSFFVGARPVRRVLPFTGDVVWQRGPGFDESGSRTTRFSTPDETVVFADAALAADALIEYSFIEPAVYPDRAAPVRFTPSIHFRHTGRRANIAYMDGSVRQETFAVSAPPIVYPLASEDFDIGWFHTEATNAPFDYQ
jgi:prepilin-type N-terminal cleavage/methylation domain-containing protein/prepilin-type processing-associated H-X9-DG protein